MSTEKIDPDPAPAIPGNLTVPIKLDAFIFNQSVCNNEDHQKVKIAPITQPNYTFLRMNDYLVQHDVLHHVDLHNSAPSSRNSRFTDIGQGTTRQNRVGVYLHWMIPKPFRSGVAGTASAHTKLSDVERAMGMYRNLDAIILESRESDSTGPSFPAIPNRWLVIRTLDPQSLATVPQGTSIPKVKVWVLESDKTESIDDLSEEVDLQVDVSPFITAFLRDDTDAKDISVDEQAEVFIGKCVDASDWTESLEESWSSRVNIDARSSSNQLFMDFQYHCGNVFSMVDNLSYVSEDGKTKYLEAARPSYYVLGWHNDKEKDLMFLKKDPAIENKVTREQRMKALSMNLANAKVPDAEGLAHWLRSPESSRTLCHGALYDVQWLNRWDETDDNFKPPEVPGDAFAKILAESKNLAVGTTPTDSILAHVKEHQKDSGLEHCLMRLETLLRAEDDSIGGQEIVSDEVQNVHFSRFDGGSRYALSDADLTDPTMRPDVDQKKQLKDINAQQHLHDAIIRRMKQLQWETFAIWWKYISDIDNEGGAKDGIYRRDVEKVVDKLGDLDSVAKELRKIIHANISPENKNFATPKEAVRGSFHQQNDPTLLFAGLESGWPKDFQNALSVRLDNQFTYPDQPSNGEMRQKYKLKCLPTDLESTGIRLVEEFLQLHPQTGDPLQPGVNQILPLYHDGTDSQYPPTAGDRWRDRWSSRQPWFPLYIEWKAEYYHIPFDKWSLIDRTMDATLTTKRTLYGLKDDITSGFDKDIRIVSGRNLILPQPSVALKVLLERLFNTIPLEELNKLLTPVEREGLIQGLDGLGFLSTPLSGLTDHLATRFNGSHVKPLIRVPNSVPVPLEAARAAAEKIQITSGILAQIDIESDPTPYGSIVSMRNTGFSAFKSVTHGQMRFTHVNVIDKFGQVAHANDPLQDDNVAIIPVISDYYHPAATKTGDLPNVVKPDIQDKDHPEFIQLPPTINQPARLNAEFVMRNQDTGEWNVVDAWENPIWGWVVVNFADNALQFFLSEGTFYREVRITQGSQDQEVKWLPFEPPNVEVEHGQGQQLDFLIAKMTENDETAKHYHGEFWSMIASSVSHINQAPDTYSQFLNSLVGRPLAMVNMGWSLELDAASRKNQSTIVGQDVPPVLGLLPGDGDKTYSFPVKFGDKDRAHDGLVGYFEPRLKNEKVGTNDDLVLEKCFTYYGEKISPVYDGPLLLTQPSARYPEFSATWVDPSEYAKKKPEVAAELYEQAYNRNLSVFGAIVDPFLPINAYTSILPIKSLKLPTWTWESALKKMTTFIHAGPLNVTTDVPSFDKEKILTKQYNLTVADMAGTVSLPALQVADWAWLQPYDVAREEPKNKLEFGIQVISDDDEEEERVSAYMPLEIDKVDVRPSYQKGPYTAIEGYMQLKSPIEREREKEK